MVNVVLIKTWVSRLALGRDALVLEGALVEIHEDSRRGKEENDDGKSLFDQDEGIRPAWLRVWEGREVRGRM